MNIEGKQEITLHARYPLPFKLYKGVKGDNGAFQLSLIPAYFGERDLGVVFLEMAATIGNNVYDWDNKIKMALNLSDIAVILNAFRSPQSIPVEGVQIYHDKYKGTEKAGQVKTTLKLLRGQKYGFFINIFRDENGQSRYVTMPISDGEAIEIRILLERAVPAILGW